MVPNASGTAGFISNAADSPTVEQSVTTHPDLDPELEEIRGNTDARKQWLLADLGGVDGYRATVASEHSYSSLETYTWH